MMKHIIKITVVIMIMGIAIPHPAWADELTDSENKAAEIHKIAGSDAIYSQEEIKAIYYQNSVMISLLKEIRDLLAAQKEDHEEAKQTQR